MRRSRSSGSPTVRTSSGTSWAASVPTASGCDATAVLLPDPENPQDPNAVKVLIEGRHVGYLSRGDAVVYLPGLQRLFLDHDPADFGLVPRQTGHIGELRTGFSEALATDRDDDGYDLSWHGQLSGNHTPADVVVLRKLLASERDPIDRPLHAGGAEQVPLQEPRRVHLRQAAIRCQKARDWSRMRSWAERGLAVYGSDAARPEAVADLQKRLAYAEDKLAGAAVPRATSHATRSAVSSSRAAVPTMETLVCSSCGNEFQRARSRGRKPHRCPNCRDAA